MEQPVRPQSIGPYEITGTVGAGGMGVVYRAVHCRTGQLAALKTVVGAEGEMLAGLRREIRAIERLRHPGVVRIYEHGVERGLPWYAMELVDGQPLLDCLPASKWRDATRDEMEETERNPPRRKLPDNFRQLLTLACRLCRTLAYVHGKGIVHRDLKPENVMVRRDGTPLLMDFGLVAQFRVAGRETVASENMAVGTASYLSPEQAAGQLVDARADLYTYGIMLNEIVSGRLPFTSWSVQEILKQHLYEPPPPLSR
ncbi:MAG TPA: serine/threonine-protein kinase, partial [Thermoanaerobaculia bacterium]